MTTSFSAVADEYLATNPCESELNAAHTFSQSDKTTIRMRVIKFCCMELPAYQADLDRGGYTTERAKKRMKHRVMERYRQDYGFVFLIPVAVLIGTIVLAAVTWLVERVLDHLFPEKLQSIAAQAESWQEDSDE